MAKSRLARLKLRLAQASYCMTCSNIWYYANARLQQNPNFHNSYLQPNDPGPHEAIALQVPQDHIEDNPSNILLMAQSISEVVTVLSPPLEGSPYLSYRGDLGLTNAIQQSVDSGLAYPIGYLT
jgi:hypothetical protein